MFIIKAKWPTILMKFCIEKNYYQGNLQTSLVTIKKKNSNIVNVKVPGPHKYVGDLTNKYEMLTFRSQ